MCVVEKDVFKIEPKSEKCQDHIHIENSDLKNLQMIKR